MIETKTIICDICRERKSINVCAACHKDLCKTCNTPSNNQYNCGYGEVMNLSISLCSNCKTSFEKAVKSDDTIRREIIQPQFTEMLMEIIRALPKVDIANSLEKGNRK